MQKLSSKKILRDFNEIVDRLKITGNKFIYFSDTINNKWIDKKFIKKINAGEYDIYTNISSWIGYFKFVGEKSLKIYTCSVSYNYISDRFEFSIQTLFNDYENVESIDIIDIYNMSSVFDKENYIMKIEKNKHKSKIESFINSFYIFEEALKYAQKIKKMNDPKNYLNNNILKEKDFIYEISMEPLVKEFNEDMLNNEKYYLPNIYKTINEAYPINIIAKKVLESSISIPYAGGNYGIYLIIGEYTIKKYSDWDY